VSISTQTVDALLQAISEKKPTPGGGAVAALTLALAASLAEMVLNYSHGKKSLAQHADAHLRTLAQSQGIRARALDLADKDAQVYAALNAIQRQKDVAPSDESFQRAVRDAIEVPMDVLHRSAQLAEILDSLVGTTNRYLDSDLAMAAVLAEAAAQSACWNIRINLPGLTDEANRAAAEAEMNEHMERAAAAARRVQDALNRPAK
jgi:formiminotetrahydrofolate cyclodeaminase